MRRVKRIKHWAGYGSITAEFTLWDENKKLVIIDVSGSHECGLTPYYYNPILIEQWLLKKYLKDKIVDKYKTIEAIGKDRTDHAVFYIYYK